MRSTILLDGAFDPLHAGHVAYIQAARRAFPDDQIVVAIAPDAAIREKGRDPLLSQQARADVVGQIKGVDAVFLKFQPTEQAIAALKPAFYVKGKDWEGRLPEAQVEACLAHGVQIVYLSGETRESSTALLRRWALKDAEASLDRLSRFMAHQRTPEPWQPVTDYSFEARKAIEGPHAELIERVFQAAGILDVGCGPGHLVRMLKDVRNEFHVCGLDLAPETEDNQSWYTQGDIADRNLKAFRRSSASYEGHDLVICREVLEHLPVRDIATAVANLFKLSSKYVYITTRFSTDAVFDASTDFETDPTHITCLSQPFLRALCVLNGGVRRRGLEETLDHQQKGRVLVYEVTR